FRGEAGEAVEQMALLRRVEGPQSFALRMDQGEFRGEKPQYRDRGWLIVHVDAALAVLHDFAAENNFVALDVDAIGLQRGFGTGRAFKNTGDNGAVGAVTNHVGGR